MKSPIDCDDVTGVGNGFDQIGAVLCRKFLVFACRFVWPHLSTVSSSGAAAYGAGIVVAGSILLWWSIYLPVILTHGVSAVLWPGEFTSFTNLILRHAGLARSSEAMIFSVARERRRYRDVVATNAIAERGAGGPARHHLSYAVDLIGRCDAMRSRPLVSTALVRIRHHATILDDHV